MKRLLLVSDDRTVARLFRKTGKQQAHELPGGWQIERVSSPEAAWDRLQAEPFDAVLLDTGPKGKGPRHAARQAARSAPARRAGSTSNDLFALTRRLQEPGRALAVPALFLVHPDDLRSRRKAWQSGAADVICRPLVLEELQTRLWRLLASGGTGPAGAERSHSHGLPPAASAKRNSPQLWPALRLVWRLAAAAECADGSAALHVVRVGLTSRELARTLGLSAAQAELLLWAAPLHDLGNLAVPREILQKPEPLDPDDWAVLKEHCRLGARLLAEGADSPPLPARLPGLLRPLARAGAQVKRLLQTAATVALTHHERWNGSGYPQGLGEREIPLEGRIVAVADVFDSLTSPRPYRGAYPEPIALEIMENTSGKLFDPEVYVAFLQALPRIRAIRQVLAGAAGAEELSATVRSTICAGAECSLLG